MMWTPMSIIILMIVIIVIVPYIHIVIYISSHQTPRPYNNGSIAVPDISVDIPVVSVTSPPSRHAWMTAIGPHIHDKLITDIFIPGTHQSASYSVHSNGILVERSFIYNVMLTAGFRSQVVRWLQTQDLDITDQLHQGIRALHFKVVVINGQFYCYNGLTGDLFTSVLSQIRNFVDSYGGEIILVYLDDLQELSEGVLKNAAEENLQTFHQLILHELRKDLVPFNAVLPTVGQILNSGKNIIIFSNYTGLGEQNQTWFWPKLLTRIFRQEYSTPQELFTFLSEMQSVSLAKQAEKKMNLAFVCTVPSMHCYWTSFLHSRLFLSMTLSFATVSGYLMGSFICYQINIRTNSYNLKVMSRRSRSIIVVLLTTILVCVLCVLFVSFFRYAFGLEGCEAAIMEMGEFVNTESKLLPLNSYPSLIYSDNGFNFAIAFWLSKPALYKVNVVFVDNLQTSNVVRAAIDVNRGSLGRKINIVFVGNPLVGRGNIRSWFSCATCQISYLLVSRDEGRVVTWASVSPGGRVTFQDEQYPMDSQVIIFAGSSSWGKWFQLYSGNLQRWIDSGQDLYIRCSESRTGRGVAYISDNFHSTSSICLPATQKGSLNFTTWDFNTTPISRKSSTKPSVVTF